MTNLLQQEYLIVLLHWALDLDSYFLACSPLLYRPPIDLHGVDDLLYGSRWSLNADSATHAQRLFKLDGSNTYVAKEAGYYPDLLLLNLLR